MAYSTVLELKYNVASLNERQSNIEDSELAAIITQADNQVKIDLSPYYTISDLSSDVLIVNILSQYKAAEVASTSFYGATRATENKEGNYWGNKYKEIMNQVQHGMGLINITTNTFLTRRNLSELVDQNDYVKSQQELAQEEGYIVLKYGVYDNGLD